MGKSLLLSGKRKASDILLEHFEPILKELLQTKTEKEILHILSTPIMIWNAMSFEDAGRKGWIGKIFGSFDALPSEDQANLDSCIFYWIRRKVELFPDEKWCIRKVNFRTTMTGEKNLRAIVTLPSEIEHLAPENWMRVMSGGLKENAHP